MPETQKLDFIREIGFTHMRISGNLVSFVSLFWCFVDGCSRGGILGASLVALVVVAHSFSFPIVRVAASTHWDYRQKIAVWPYRNLWSKFRGSGALDLSRATLTGRTLDPRFQNTHRHNVHQRHCGCRGGSGVGSSHWPQTLDRRFQNICMIIYTLIWISMIALKSIFSWGVSVDYMPCTTHPTTTTILSSLLSLLSLYSHHCFHYYHYTASPPSSFSSLHM